jgi:hypothetical protein
MKKILTIIHFLFVAFSGKAQLNNEWIDYNKTYYKFLIGEDGICRISKTTLDSWGIGNTPAQNFQLWRNGVEVPLFTSESTGALSGNGFIEFIGRKNDGVPDRNVYLQANYQLSNKQSLFTDTAAYFLTVNASTANRRFTDIANDLTGNLPSPLPYLLHTVRHDYKRPGGQYYVNKGFAVNYGEYVYSSSYDIGEMLSSEDISPGTAQANRTAVFNNLLPAQIPGINARFRVGWASSAAVPGVSSRDITASIGNTTIATRRLNNFQAFRDSNVSVSTALLEGPSTTIAITNLSTNQFDRVVAGFCEIEYPRQSNAGGSSFFESSIPAGGSEVLLQLSNFNHGGVAPVLYNLTTGSRMRGDIDPNGTVRFRVPQFGARQYFVVTSYSGNFFRNINQATSKTFINYSLGNQSGDYLIITNNRLLGGNAIENYRAYRASAAGGGFNTKIYDIEDLVDQFAFGIKMHPLSIKNFLRFARQNFSTPPKFCFLIGKGVTYDEFRANESSPLASQLQLVPTFGYPGSDNLLASNDLTALPATPIGRLSAVNAAEITAYLNKVKEFEGAQANPSVSQLDKAWMKNVVHVVGANDAGTELQIRPFMNEYERVVKDTLLGGSVTTFNKFNSTTASTIENVVLSNLFQTGISLLTYFGHSSATALDYNLDDPNQYNNPGKYPVFMLNGCNAGNFFTFERQRLEVQSTISERYVLAPDRGAIGLVASTHFGLVSGLGVYTRGFYRSLSFQSYAETIGKHIQNSVQFMYNTWGTDYQARFHTEQQTLHGDPAIKINSFSKPDYSVESQNIVIEPSFLSIAETKFDSKIYYYNIGKAINDSMVVEVRRQYPESPIYPNGFTETVYRQKRKAPLYLDSLELSFPIISERDKGINLITVTLDADNTIDEISELNNTLVRQVVIFENELRPVYPINFAIVNKSDAKLFASTANPFSEPLNYSFEIDTTDQFNSTSKISRTINARGGIVEIDPGINYVNNRVYYWRLGLQPQAGGTPLRWNHASFIYLSGSETGFNQSHFYQHTKSVANRVRIDSSSREWTYNESLNNLFVTHSIFPTSGNEDSHFSLSVNNNILSSSACVGHSLIYNVFDALTFKPLLVNGSWTSGYCNPNRNPFNYEWDDRNTANRKQMMDFMDSIPSGSFVVVRKILDAPYENETFAEKLKADETIYGAGNSLYHKLKDAGFATIDSFNRPRTFVFIYKKNDGRAFSDLRMSDGLFDRIQMNLNIPTIDTFGIVSSPILGPARNWKNAKWNGSPLDNGTGDRVRIKVVGLSPSGVETRLFDVPESQSDIDLTSINAQQYPQLKLVMENTDSIKGTPWNLNFWRVYYTPVPEGALAGNMLLQDQDSLLQGQPYDFKIAFKNISDYNFDSLKVRLSVTNSSNVTTTTDIKRRPLPAGDTLIISFPLDSRQYPGLNTIYIAANPDNNQPEQYFFNNFLYNSFFVKEDLTDPLLDVTFDGIHILNKDIVSARPHIQIKLKDENTFALLNDTAGVSIRLQFPGENNPRVYRWNTDTLRFIPPTIGNDNTATIDFFPVLQVDSENSEYELTVGGRDRNDNRAGEKDYRVNFRVFNKPMISNLLNYPNPFSTSTAFVFTITGAEVPQEFKIQILTVTGKIVKEITKAELGPIRVGTNITDYKWDGTDMFGQKLANGVYLYRVITSLDGNKMEQFKLNDGFNQNTMDVTDQFFKKGYGKMVILR